MSIGQESSRSITEALAPCEKVDDTPENTLVLVTYQFPYLPGEYFIETEIEYLSKAYRKVIILPMRRAWTVKPLQKRTFTAPHIVVDPGTNVPAFLVLLLRACVEAPILVWRYRRTWSGSSEVPDSSLLQWLKSAVKVSLARLAISRCFPEGTQQYTFLSYWRLEAAAALGLLKESGHIRAFFSRAHGGDLYIAHRYPFESLVHVQADAVLPVSNNGRAFLVDVKGFRPDNLAVHRLGIRLSANISPASKDGIVRIVSCSDVIPIKRVSLIARYLATLPYPVHWVHFGDGVDLSLVEDEISRFDSRHHARLMGRVPNQMIYEFYRNNAVDLFINLSETEGVPVSIMEALAHGIPTIATDVGGTSELVDNSCGHLLSPTFDPVELSSAVARLLSPDSRSTHRMNARRRAEAVCDAERNYRGTYDLIRELSSSTRPEEDA